MLARDLGDLPALLMNRLTGVVMEVRKRVEEVLAMLEGPKVGPGSSRAPQRAE